MGRITGATLCAFAAAFAFTAMPASATTIEECKASIATLQTATAAAEFIGRNAAKDEAGLIGKLGEASNKLSVAKLADASKKVTDYQNQLVSLVQAGKIAQISPDGGLTPAYAELSAGAADVQTCIADIGK